MEEYRARIHRDGSAFTIVLAVVSIKQGDTARKAVRRATQSAEAALRAAKATERSNEIAAEALRQTKLRERSTLVIEDFKIRNFPSAPRLSFCVRNVGEQPASQIAINGPLSGMELMKRKSQASRRPELGFRPGAVGPGANGIRGQVFQPDVTGPTLAQGSQHCYDFRLTNWPMDIPPSQRPKGFTDFPTIADVINGDATYWVEMLVSYHDDVFETARMSGECLAYWKGEFIPCSGGHILR